MLGRVALVTEGEEVRHTLDLLTALRKEAFDKHYEPLTEYLKHDSIYVACLRGHAHLEAMVQELLERNIENLKPIKDYLEKQAFSNAVMWAEALGELPPELAKAIRRFSKLRNSVAHSFENKLTEDDVTKMVGELGDSEIIKFIRYAEVEVFKRDESIADHHLLRAVIYILCMKTMHHVGRIPRYIERSEAGAKGLQTWLAQWLTNLNQAHNTADDDKVYD